MYLRVDWNLEFLEIGSRLAPDALPESLAHDFENVYEWMWVNIVGVPFALNVSREHGWAGIDDDIESGASMEELRELARPGPVYLSGWNRATDLYVDELPGWLPQFVADRLGTDVFVYHGRVNAEIPDAEPAAVFRPQQRYRT